MDFYNDWFIKFAPKAYRTVRSGTILRVENTFEVTKNLSDLSPRNLRQRPEVLQILRMCTAPPIARDRLIGLARVSSNLVKSMEGKNRIPPSMGNEKVETELKKIKKTLIGLLDVEIFSWIGKKSETNRNSLYRAVTIIVDRLCGTIADPIIRNAQEARPVKVNREMARS